MEFHETKTYKAVASQLAIATHNFMKTGVAFIPKNTSLPAIVNQGGMLSYLKDLAKELDRPFVHAYDVFTSSSQGPLISVYLKVPKIERFHKLISGLLILAVKKQVKRDLYFSSDPISFYRSASMTEFKFRGRDSVKVFMHWYDQCRDDPVFRVLLRHD